MEDIVRVWEAVNIMSNKKIQISKLDAARRQLETGIRLYFKNSDPVSIHTLIAASYNVVRDINKKRGGTPLLAKDVILDYIKEGHEKEVRNKINAAENFFKHADSDHNEVIDFNPEQSEFLILEACSTYFKITGDDPVLFKIYRMWYIANHPKMFKYSADEQSVISRAKQDMIGLGREGYFNLILPELMRL